MRKIKINKFVLIFTVLLLLSAFFVSRVRIRNAYDEFREPDLPEAREFQVSNNKLQEEEGGVVGKDNANVSGFSDVGDDTNDKIQIPDDIHGDPSVSLRGVYPEYARGAQDDVVGLQKEYNLAVPFQPQAPFANWDMPYQEACEEASLIMAYKFFTGSDLSAREMDKDILQLIDWQIERFGYYENTTSQEVVIIAKEYFHLNINLDYDVAVENIKKHISQNKLIIIPAAGRLLPNPYFSGEGPLYHMLVIRGYTDKYFITNDPGTKRGEEFLYKYDDLINAIHDWSNDFGIYNDDVIAEKILTGEKVMIVVGQLACSS